MAVTTQQAGQLYSFKFMDILCYPERSDGLQIKAFAQSRPGMPRVETLPPRDSFFVHIVLSGSCDFYGKELHAGDAFFLTHRKPYTNRISEDYSVMWFDLAGERAAPLLESFGLSLSDHASYRVRHSEYVRASLQQFYSFCETHLDESACVAEGAMYFFLSSLDTGSRTIIEPDVMEQAAEFFRDYYFRPIRMEQIARQFFLSEKYFCRRFRERYGVPPQKYLQSLRMKRAAEMLRSTDLRIAEIAAAVGYESPLSFTTTFKKNHGVTPGEYRRNGGDV